MYNRAQRRFIKILILSILASMYSKVQSKQQLVKHLLLLCIIIYQDKFILFKVLVDIDALEFAFIDQFYAQQYHIFMYLLKKRITITIFDKIFVVIDFITHYCFLNFRDKVDKHQLITLYVTNLSQWFVVFEIFWLHANKTRLNFDILFIAILNSNSRTSQSIVIASFASHIFVSLKIFKSQKRSFAFEFTQNVVISHIDIFTIDVASLARLARKKDHQIDVIIFKDIEKILSLKNKLDSTTLLFKKYHEFLNIFFQKIVEELSSHRLYDHKIQLSKNKKLNFDSLYDMFENEFLMLQKYFQNNFKKEFIRSSSFSIVASMFFVKKLDENFRFCVDYRDLNAISLKNRYSLSLFRETLNRLNSVKYYFKIDIIVAFNHLRIVFDEKYKIAFRTRYDLYEYFVMSFELVNVSFIWQHFINDIFRNKLNIFCIVYLNDILIYSNIKKQYDEHIRWIFNQFRKIDIQTIIKKCEFNVQKIKYLDLIIIIDDIRMNFEKIKVILKWKTLNCVKNVQNFLDFDNFYRRLVRVFSKFVESLTKLIKKD